MKSRMAILVLNQAPLHLSSLVLTSLVMVLLVSCACSVQVDECNRQPNRTEIEATIARIESRNSPEQSLPASRIKITLLHVHFTCLAARGLDLYSSAVVAVNYTSNASRNTPTTAHFAMQCRNGTAFSLLDILNFRMNVDGSVFDMETRTDCVDCELFQPIKTVVVRRQSRNVESGCIGEILTSQLRNLQYCM